MTTPRQLGIIASPSELCLLRRCPVRVLQETAAISLNTVHRALAGQPVHRSTLRALLGAASSLNLPADQDQAEVLAS